MRAPLRLLLLICGVSSLSLPALRAQEPSDELSWLAGEGQDMTGPSFDEPFPWTALDQPEGPASTIAPPAVRAPEPAALLHSLSEKARPASEPEIRAIDPFVARPRPPDTTESLGPAGSRANSIPPQEPEEDFLRQAQYPLDNDIFTGETTEQLVPEWQPPVLPTPPPPEPDGGFGVSLDGLQLDVARIFGRDELGLLSFDLRADVGCEALPGFAIRPRFAWHFVEGPSATDLPPRLYDASIEARMYWPIGERWLTEFAVAPSVFSDFRNVSSDALRIVGRALAFYRWSPELQLAFGFAYLDREDVTALPLGGIIWVPDPDLRFELMAPRPRIAVRYGGDERHDRWAYIAGEFGGGSWAIQRVPSGVDDIATYRDFRLLVGVDVKFADNSGWRVEGGYLFGRELEYASGIGDVGLAATALIRVGVFF